MCMHWTGNYTQLFKDLVGWQSLKHAQVDEVKSRLTVTHGCISSRAACALLGLHKEAGIIGELHVNDILPVDVGRACTKSREAAILR